MNQHRSLMTTTALSGALAITGIALTSGVASAAVTASFNGGNNINFATQAATASSGAISLTAGQVLNLTLPSGDYCPANSTITLTAPAGVTFTSAPGFTTAGATWGAAAASGFVSGASTVTYLVSTALTGAADNLVTIGGTTGIFTLASGTTFTTASTTPRTFTLSQSGCTTSGIGQSTAGFTAASAISYTATAGTNASIDTGATGQGKLFTASATNSTRVAVGGTAQFGIATTLINTAGGTTYNAGASTGVVTMTGVFSQFARVYLANGACNTTAGGALPTGSITGVISGSTATFSGLQTTATYTACFENDGSSVLQSGTYTSSASASAISGTVAGTGALGVFTYSGTATTINYVTGGSAYQYFARVTNTNNSPVSVFVVVTKDDGSTPAAGLITTNLGANANALYSMTDINTASGANLTAADRARVQVLTSGSAGTTPIQGILFNTATGVVTAAQ